MHLVSVLDKHPVVTMGLKTLFAQIDGNPFFIDKVFNDKKELLNSLDHWRADILLTDIQPSKAEDLELIRILQVKYPCLKIIIYTGNYDKETLLASIKTNVQGVISKAVSISTIISCFESVLQSNRFLTAGNDEFLTFNKLKSHLYSENREKQLTAREKEVINLVIEGSTNKEISVVLNISTSTVEFHKKNIYQKLEVNNIPELLKKVYT